MFAVWFLLVLSVVGIAVLLSNSQPRFVDEPASTTTAPLPLEPAAYDVRGVAVAPDGSLWAATDAGIGHWNLTTGTLTLYTTGDGLPTDDAFRVVVGSDGAVWTGGSGWMARFDGSWTTFSAPERPMAVGPDGAVWTAVGESDLARFDGSEWQTFEVPLSLEQGIAASPGFFDVAADGTVWGGTNNFQGVFAFDGANWTRYTSVDGLPGPLSGTVAAAPDGTVWVGSVSLNGSPGAGAARFDGSTWTVYTTADGLLDDVPDVAVGADGTVWAIHQNGVSRFDGDTWTAFPGVAGFGMFAAVDASGTLWMPARDGGVIGFDGVDITRLEVPAKETPSPATTVTGRAGTWNPILATTLAKPAPPAASCPLGTDPNAPGPADQERPEAGWTSLLAAAFDRHAGRIVYVDTLGETWAFDVCTNTWHRMNPTGAMIGELSVGMVYDVDSDLTVALGFEHISVYDANTNTWTQPSNDGLGFNTDDITPFGGTYDPVTGLIITSNLRWTSETSPTYWEFWAYDVDTNEWTLLGPLNMEPEAQDQLDFLGYSERLDRLIVAGSVDGEVGTILVDPRTGAVTVLPIETPVVDLIWPNETYGAAGGTVFATTNTMDTPHDICGFDANVKSWTACFDTPEVAQTDRHERFDAMVGDPINQRLILINGIGGGWSSEVVTADDVWTIDLDTGEWTQLLAPSGPAGG